MSNGRNKKISKPFWLIFRTILATAIVFTQMAGGVLPVVAATGAPKIINHQGRLLDASGSLLGGDGTDFCFKFSFFADATVGTPDTQLWPASTPSRMTVSVVNGVYSVGIGDTGAGGDLLDFDFQSTDAAFLNIEVASKVGATCAFGDGAEVFENLSPRQRIGSSGYALNANTLGGFTPSQTPTGSNIPVLTSGVLSLAGNIDTAGVLQVGSGNVNITTTTGALDADALGLISGDGTGSTSSGSGLEVDTDRIGLVQGCANNEVLKWNDGSSVWQCAADVGGTSTLQSAYDSGASITTAGAVDLSFVLTSGNFTVSGAGSVNLTPTGASSFTSGGALTFTAGAASTWGTSAGNLNLQVGSTGTTATVQIGLGGVGSTTPDLLALDVKSTTGDPTGFDGAMYYNQADNLFRCFQNGVWDNCITEHSAPISALTPATTSNSINNGDHAQVWNWSLSTASQTGLVFGENSPSTASGTPAIVMARTQALSTATPLRIENFGEANSFRIDDVSGDTSPFIIDNDGNVAIGSDTFAPGTLHERLKVEGIPGNSAVISANGDLNSGLASAVKNRNSGTLAASAFVAAADNFVSGTNQNSLVLGIGSSGFNNPANPIIGANEAFVASFGTGLTISTVIPTRPIKFATGGTALANERMRIDGTGNVGIGTTAPGSKLDVKGTLRLSGSSSGFVGFAPAAAAGSTTYTLPSADGTNGFVLTTDGSGVMTWTDAGAKFGRSGTTLSPLTAGDDITTSGAIYTSGSGQITSAGLLTGSAGLSVTGAAVNLNASSNNATNINTGTSTGAVTIGNSLAGVILAQSATTVSLQGGSSVITSGSTGITLQSQGSGTAAAVQIGVGGAGSTTPDLLGLDVKSDVGDPTGFNGAMYYNENTDQFRCFTNGSWGNCDTTGGTATLQSAYNAGATITTGSSTDLALTLTSGNFTASGAGSVNLTPTGASSFTSSGALTFTAGAASTWGTTTGDLTLQVAGTGTVGSVKIGAGGAGSATPDLLALDVKSTTGDPAGFNGATYYNEFSGKFRCFEASGWKDCDTGAGAGNSLQQSYNVGSTITTAASTDLSFVLSSGNFTTSGAGSVNLTPTGASSFTSSGALTFTAGAASVWSTTAGNLTVDAAAALNLGTTNATSVSIGNTGVTTTNNGSLTSTQTLTASNGFTQTTGALNLTATSGALTLSGLSASSISAGSNALSLVGSPININATGTGTTNIGSATALINLPGLTASKVVFTDSSKNLTSTGTVGITQGGTGQATASAAFDALSPTSAVGDIIVRNGSGNVRLPVGGTNGFVLTVDSTQATGIKWAAAGAQTLQTAYDAGSTITTAASTDIALTLTSGNFTATGAGSVNLTPTAASNFTSGGALTFTAGASSVWSTTAGSLRVDAATTLNLGTTAATVINVGGSSNTALTVTTDGTGDAEVVLPTGSISGTEILNDTVVLGTDTAGNYVASFTAGGGLTGDTAGEGTTPTIAVVSGNGGIVVNANDVALTVAPSADALSATTSSGSGLEIVSTGVALIQGCANNEILKWNETSDVWACSSDVTGGTPTLDAVAAATANGAVNDSNANTVNWNWDFTTAAVDSGLNISESTASTSGTQDQQALLELTTLASSTASPLQVTAGGTDVGDIFFDLTGTSDLEIRDSGVVFASFNDNGSVSFAGNITQTGATSISSGTGGITANGNLVTSNLGVELTESDTNPSCASGDYKIYADTSETQIKKCVNGVATNLTSSDSFKFVAKSADESVINSTTLQSDDDLLFAIGASETWGFIFAVDVANANSNGPDWKAAILGPTLNTCSVTQSGAEPAGAAFPQASTVDCITPAALVNNNINADAGFPYQVRISGFVAAALTGGTVNFQYAENTAALATSVTVKKGSTLTAYKVGGADLAEVYYSKEFLAPGTLLVVDPEVTNGVKMSAGAYDDRTMGVVSTTPGLVLGDNQGAEDRVSTLVALSGRVPVKVSTENGSIEAGDFLTASSMPGVAMKATKAGRTVGLALAKFEGEGVGEVMTFVNNGYYTGSAYFEEVPAVEAGKPTGREVLTAINKIVPADSAAGGVSQIYADRLLAAVDIVTPSITANTLTVDSIESVENSLSINLGVGGSMVVQAVVPASEDGVVPETKKAVITFDDAGNASFAGTVTAGAIKADSITGIEIFTDRIATLSDSVADLNVAATDVASTDIDELQGQIDQLNESVTGLTNEVMARESGVIAQITDLATKQTGLYDSLLVRLDTLAAEQLTTNGTLIDGLATIDTRVSVVENDLTEVKKQLAAMMEVDAMVAEEEFDLVTTNLGNLNVAGAFTLDSVGTFAKGIEVTSISALTDAILFNGDLKFIGRPYVNNDTAGFAVIPAGAREVAVEFKSEYLTQPVVTASVTLEEARVDGTLMGGIEEVFFADNLQFLVVNKTTRGFTIKLNRAATDEVRFSWIALAVDEARVVIGKNEAVIIIEESAEELVPAEPVVVEEAVQVGEVTDEQPPLAEELEAVPVVEQPVEPIIEPATEMVVEPAVEPVVDPVVEPVIEPVVESEDVPSPVEIVTEPTL